MNLAWAAIAWAWSVDPVPAADGSAPRIEQGMIVEIKGHVVASAIAAGNPGVAEAHHG